MRKDKGYVVHKEEIIKEEVQNYEKYKGYDIGRVIREKRRAGN